MIWAFAAGAGEQREDASHRKDRMQHEPVEVMTRRAMRAQESHHRGSHRMPRGAARRAARAARAERTERTAHVARVTRAVRIERADEAARRARAEHISRRSAERADASRGGTNRDGHRRAVFTAVASSFGLAASLIIAGPAQAAPAHQFDAATEHTQGIRVAGDVTRARLVLDDYSANELVGVVSAASGNGGHDAAVAVALALNAGGERATIVRTALDYFGDPYVLGGADHAGIDCSGLTMRAYAAVGIRMAHYVPTQDAMGVRITEAQAQPGDFVTFDDEEHIGIYLGNGMVLHAPATGRTVSIEAVSVWQSVGIHFTRILSL